MDAKQVTAIILSIVLIGTFTGAVIGAVSWLSFWILAVLLVAYVTYFKNR